MKNKSRKPAYYIDRLSLKIDKIAEDICACVKHIQEIKDKNEREHYYKEFFKLVHLKVSSLYHALNSGLNKAGDGKEVKND